MQGANYSNFGSPLTGGRSQSREPNKKKHDIYQMFIDREKSRAREEANKKEDP